MRKVYLIAFSPDLGSHEPLKRWADSDSRVLSWRYDLPYCFYVAAEVTAAELTQSLRATLGTQPRFLVTEITENTQGWLPADTWYFLRYKRAKSEGNPAPTTAAV